MVWNDDDYCDHEDYVSEEEVLRQIAHEAAYHDMCEREERRQWWRGLFAPVMDPFRNLLWKIRRPRDRPITDDDIPF